MPSLHRSILLFLLICRASLSSAQIDLQGEASGADVIVHGRSKASEAGELLFQAVWRGVTTATPTFDLQPMSASLEDQPLFLDRLIETGLGAYMDQRIHFSKQGVTADVPAEQMALEMGEMVQAALRSLAIEAGSTGFSAATKEQLARLVVIDWSQARHAVNGGNDQDKYLAIYYYVRSQREEFERLMRRDLLPLASIDIFEQEEQKRPNVPIASTCGTVFDDDQYLCALDLQLADVNASGMDVDLPDQLVMSMSSADDRSREGSVRKRDRWLKAELDQINEPIDKIDQRQELWELRDRMDDLNDRLTGLELEVRENRSGSSSENALADLSKSSGHDLTIRFERGSTSVDPEYHVLLNEVVDQLISSPNDRILITGYTDRVGDPKVNMKLSEKRAKAVREHLLERGIAAERLLINYYGDSRSDMNDPSQRRVEIEWLD